MRQTTTITYRYSELTEDAQEVAREQIRDRLGYWIESEDLEEEMVEVLGYLLGHHSGGLGEPLRGIEISEWSIDRNGRDYLRISGTLHRDTTPNLPWPEDCSYARFGRVNQEWTGSDRNLWLEDSNPEWMADDDREDVAAFWDAIDAKLSATLEAGCAQYDYLTSEEYATEWLDANDPEMFSVEGEIQ